MWERKHLQWESCIRCIPSSVSRGPHQQRTQKSNWHNEREVEFHREGRKKENITSLSSLSLSVSLTFGIFLRVCKTTKGETSEPLVWAAQCHRRNVPLVCVCVCLDDSVQPQPAYLTCLPTWEPLNAPQLYGGPFSDQCLIPQSEWVSDATCLWARMQPKCWLADILDWFCRFTSNWQQSNHYMPHFVGQHTLNSGFTTNTDHPGWEVPLPFTHCGHMLNKASLGI